MKSETKRIFISDLPETTTQNDLENAISNYGQVTSVEIKERKELGLKNNSLFFAYINVDINDSSLQHCFKDFANRKFFGERLMLQVARESFLDRLKREREGSGVFKKTASDSFNVQQNKISVETPYKPKAKRTSDFVDSGTNNLKQFKANNDEYESEECDADNTKQSKENDGKITLKFNKSQNEIDTNEVIDLVIKNNKGKVIDKNGLKIESVGKAPILKIDLSKKKTSINSSEANLKRLQSLKNLKNAHKTQKSFIKQALSRIDNNSSKKLIFDNPENPTAEVSYRNNKKKKSLFDEEHQEDDFEPNFEIKEQFQGEKGHKLLELQARYKNDKRFALDSRFLEDEEHEENNNQPENNEDLSLEEEKKKEYEILEQVLGKKVLPKAQRKTELESSQKKAMLRFDPTQPGHSKFELKNEAKKEKKKRKLEVEESDELSEKKQEKDMPRVSKEVFYKVTEDLKESLKEKSDFSLLSMFGKADKGQNTQESYTDNPLPSNGIANSIIKEKNPFHYDSSDDEDETEDIPDKEKAQEVQKSSEMETSRTNRNAFWFEPFFFTDDDYRLQEGADFVEKMSTKKDEDFTKLRRNLKEIVKAKVRNNQRKNRPFKKKLGGSKKKKMLKIKRALKR